MQKEVGLADGIKLFAQARRESAFSLLTEAESADVKLLCDDIREFIKRTDTDKGGNVRAKLTRIEAFRV